MTTSIDFTVSFADRLEKKVRYVAVYSCDGKLNVARFEQKEDGKTSHSTRKNLSEKKSLEAFLNNAQFTDIIKAASRYSTEWESIEAALSAGNKVPDSKILKLVRDYPFILTKHAFTNKITDRFIDIITAATGPDKTLRRNAIDQLERHFVPNKRKAAKKMPPLKQPLVLAKKLSRHLSIRCIQALKGQGITDIKDALAVSQWAGTEQVLRTWASRDDKRISGLTTELLKALIKNPATFVDTYFQLKLDLSRRSLMRKK